MIYIWNGSPSLTQKTQVIPFDETSPTSREVAICRPRQLAAPRHAVACANLGSRAAWTAKRRRRRPQEKATSAHRGTAPMCKNVGRDISTVSCWGHRLRGTPTATHPIVACGRHTPSTSSRNNSRKLGALWHRTVCKNIDLPRRGFRLRGTLSAATAADRPACASYYHWIKKGRLRFIHITMSSIFTHGDVNESQTSIFRSIGSL